MTVIATPEITAFPDATPGCAPSSAAERFARDRLEMRSDDPEVRKAAVGRIVEWGSSAVYPLLQAVECDASVPVREAAVWALLRLTDDLLCEEVEERETVTAILLRNGVMDPYLRLGLEAVLARSVGDSPARTAAGRLIYVDRQSRLAGMRLLEDLVRHGPDLDPALAEVLGRISRRSFPGFRRGARALLEELDRWRASDAPPAGAIPALALAERRDAARRLKPTTETLQGLVVAASTDPDRTVRHIAGASLYRLVREGVRIGNPKVAHFKDDEVAYLFHPLAAELSARIDLARELRPLMGEGVRERLLLMRFLVHLRPLISEHAAVVLDELIREGLRDTDRNVRRVATAAARAASSDETCAELAGRLRGQLRRNPPVVLNFVFGAQMAVLIGGFALGKASLGFIIFQALNLLAMIYRRRKEPGGRHRIGDEEYLETLSALDRIADSSPERLRTSLPELRTLSSRMGQVSPEVRAKARELLAKVHEATLHELPIAATAPAPAPQTLPVPATPPEQKAART